MRDINEFVDTDAFYYMAKRLGINCPSVDMLRDSIFERISNFLKLRELKLSDGKIEELIFRLQVLYYAPERLVPKKQRDKDRVDKGPVPIIEDDLHKLQIALNVEPETDLEIMQSLLEIGMKESSSPEDVELKSGELLSFGLLKRAVDRSINLPII
jgi:hypothetical protein